MLLYPGGSSDVLLESVPFTGRIRAGQRLSGSTGRPFSRPVLYSREYIRFLPPTGYLNCSGLHFGILCN